MSLQQFTNLSTWREDKLTVEAGKVHTLAFMDTKPNMFYIQNPNGVKLRVSIGSIPTHENYEFKIDENTTATLGRPIQTGYLYILNDGTESAAITVYSIAKEFDMNVLKNISLVADNVSLDVDGIIRGFSDGVSLPTGSNHIGKVSIAADASGLATAEGQENAINLIKSLLHNGDADGALINQVGYMLNSLGYGNGVTTVLSLLNNANTLLTNIQSSIVTGNAYVDTYGVVPTGRHEYYKNNAVEGFSLDKSTYDYTMVYFDYLYNDSTSSTITLSLGTPGNDETWQDVFSLLPGEKIENVKFLIKPDDQFHLTIGSNPMYRAKYSHFVLGQKVYV